MRVYIFLLSLCIAMFVACQQAGEFELPESDSTQQAILTSDQEEIEAQPSTSKQARKLIKEASLSIRVDDYEDALTKIGKLVDEHEAYIGNEQERRTDMSLSNDLLIRVPSEQFETLLDAITNVAEEVTYKQISAKDVTEQFIDISARLESKKAVEKRYRELLQQAKNVEELLKVEEHLRVIREEIEATEGKLRYLKDQIALSTIQVHVSQPLTQISNTFLATTAKAFKGGWNGLLNFLVGLIYLWPFFLIVGGWLIFVRRTGRNIFGRKV